MSGRRSWEKGHRHNDNIEIIWDDGTSMVGLLEGSVTKEINGKKRSILNKFPLHPLKQN